LSKITFVDKIQVLPGPPLYQGKYNNPTGPPPTVSETGAYTGELKVKYEAVAERLALATRKMINYVNTVVWQDEKVDQIGAAGFPKAIGTMLADRGSILNSTDFLELKKAVQNM
jgi:hypothetical protein